MAIVIYGDGITEIKGRVGGIVHQKMGSSFGIRRHSIPTVQDSYNHNWQNVNCAQVGTAWKNLSVAQQTVWNNVAPGYPHFNRFGVATPINGFQLFFKINKRMAIFSLPFITVPTTYTLIPTHITTVDNVDWTNHIFNVHYDSFTANSLYFMFYLSKLMRYTSQIQHVKYYKAFVSVGSPNGTVNYWNALPPSLQVDPGPDKMFSMNAIAVEQSYGRYSLYGTVYDGQQ
jgi:hypothetical protein